MCRPLHEAAVDGGGGGMGVLNHYPVWLVTVHGCSRGTTDRKRPFPMPSCGRDKTKSALLVLWEQFKARGLGGRRSTGARIQGGTGARGQGMQGPTRVEA